MKFGILKTGAMVVLAAMLFALPQTADAANKHVLRYGTGYSQSDYGNGDAVFKTRLVQEGTIRYWEMRLPGGFWASCDGDCSEAYRLKYLDFWYESDNLHGDNFRD